MSGRLLAGCGCFNFRKGKIVNIRFSSLAVLVALCSCASASYAAEEQYQTEISALYGRSDFAQDYRLTGIGVLAEVFFAPVKTAEHPYAEAAFLERIGSVRVMALDVGTKGGGTKTDGRQLLVGVNYAKPDSPLLIQAMYGSQQYDYDTPVNAVSKGSSINLNIGNYFTHTLLVGVDYFSSKSKFSYSSYGMPTFYFRHIDYGFSAKYVNEMEHGNALSLYGSLSSSTSDDGIDNLKNTNEHLLVDYYFNPTLSAGFGIGNSSGEDLHAENRTYSMNVRHFVAPSVSVSAIYQRYLKKNDGYDDSKFTQIMMSLRF